MSCRVVPVVSRRPDVVPDSRNDDGRDLDAGPALAVPRDPRRTYAVGGGVLAAVQLPHRVHSAGGLLSCQRVVSALDLQHGDRPRRATWLRHPSGDGDDRREHVGTLAAEAVGHPSAVGVTGRVHPCAVHRVGAGDLVDERGEEADVVRQRADARRKTGV